MKQHVWVFETDGRVVVEVEDDELFDFIDDYFIETVELECEWIEPMRAQPSRHRFVFSEGTRLAEVSAAVAALDPSELHRIFLINNPG